MKLLRNEIRRFIILEKSEDTQSANEIFPDGNVSGLRRYYKIKNPNDFSAHAKIISFGFLFVMILKALDELLVTLTND